MAAGGCADRDVDAADSRRLSSETDSKGIHQPEGAAPRVQVGRGRRGAVGGTDAYRPAWDDELRVRDDGRQVGWQVDVQGMAAVGVGERIAGEIYERGGLRRLRAYGQRSTSPKPQAMSVLDYKFSKLAM